MKVVIVGTGYVGLVSGTCFAEFGFNVVCVDKRAEIIEGLQQGVVPIFEPGLNTLIEKNVKAGRLFFSTDLAASMMGAEIVFIAVGTPQSDKDGSADLSYIMEASREIAKNINQYMVVVTKSTVPVETHKKIYEEIKKETPSADFDIVSNPEFLREGCAISDFMMPDRVVIGLDSQKAKEKIERLYAPLANQNIPIIYTTSISAELIKYASNCFLATKISFINEVSNLCEKTGANVQEVARGVGLDRRIGGAFLNVGPGYGGSCFPKDTVALSKTAHQYGAPLEIVDTVIAVNTKRKIYMGQRIVHILGGCVKNKTITILGLAFKADTDDIRESPALDIIDFLQKNGALLKAYDPEAMQNASRVLTDVVLLKNPYEAMENADAIVIVTEWNEFKSLDPSLIMKKAKSPILIDLRNLYSIKEMDNIGIKYMPLGQKYD